MCIRDRFGIGGVGGFAVEALARAGIGHFELIDNDTVSVTNLNRQIIALHSTVGRYKTCLLYTSMAITGREIDTELILEMSEAYSHIPEGVENYSATKEYNTCLLYTSRCV